jgi:hypothetical protein
MAKLAAGSGQSRLPGSRVNLRNLPRVARKMAVIVQNSENQREKTLSRPERLRL